MVVFVSSPYRGDLEKNVAFAQECCAYEIALGNTPYAPHLFFPQFMEDDDMGIQHGLEILARCDELHAWGRTSPGMKMEIEYAESIGIPVRYMGRT
jgi:hypothetical protein